MRCSTIGMLDKWAMSMSNSVPEAESQHSQPVGLSFHIKCAGVASNHFPVPILSDCVVHIYHSKHSFCHQVALAIAPFKPVQFQECQRRSCMADFYTL